MPVADTFSRQFTHSAGCQYQSVFKRASSISHLVGAIFYITIFYSITDMSIEHVPGM
jgi:hypothetical protein